MGIAEKHAYRFGFLKSEWWKAFRLRELVRAKAKCHLCDKEDFSLDAHHIFYRKSLFDTLQKDIRMLCRACHDKAHEATNPGSYKTYEEALLEWCKFVIPINPKALRIPDVSEEEVIPQWSDLDEIQKRESMPARVEKRKKLAVLKAEQEVQKSIRRISGEKTPREVKVDGYIEMLRRGETPKVHENFLLFLRTELTRRDAVAEGVQPAVNQSSEALASEIQGPIKIDGSE